jgi:transketolase
MFVTGVQTCALPILRYAAKTKGNFLIAMGRNRWPVMYHEHGKAFFGDGYDFIYGKMDTIKGGEDGGIITYGGMVSRAAEIRDNLMKKGICLSVINMSCVREIDEEVMGELLKMPYIFTYEDHNLHTGIAPFIASYLLKHAYRGRMESFGVKDYGVSGDTDEVFRAEGLDVELMTEALLKAMQ